MKIQAKSQDRVIVRNGKKGKTWSKNRNKNKLGHCQEPHQIYLFSLVMHGYIRCKEKL